MSIIKKILKFFNSYEEGAGMRRLQNNSNLAPELLVANSIISLAASKGVRLTHLKLQKLLYFVYKRYLQDNDMALFSAPFEVWTYGPVVDSVYQVFKKHASNDIDDYAYPALGNKEILTVSKDDEAFHSALEAIWMAYGGHAASSLVDLTHRKDTAWYKADEEENWYIDNKYIKQEEWIY